jgi:hypothetical protein
MRKRLPPPWEWILLAFIAIAGTLAPEVPLERYGYAVTGIVICIAAAAIAIETWRREDFALWPPHAGGGKSVPDPD